MDKSIAPMGDRNQEVQAADLRSLVGAVDGSNQDPAPNGRRTPTMRDLLSVIFRHWRAVVSCFLFLACIIAIMVFSTPRRYESKMKILVKRERPQIVLTSEAADQSAILSGITQEDINSEVEILRSRDLLTKVVVQCGLHSRKAPMALLGRIRSAMSGMFGRKGEGSSAIPLAVADLESNLIVQSIPRSHMIEITYKAFNPEAAASVLETLTAAYLEKHMAVHNPPEILNFFKQQAGEYRNKLESVERQLQEFGETEKVLSVNLEKDLNLRTLSEFESRLHENEAAVAALDDRIDSINAQLKTTPDRVTAQVRTADDPILMQQLKTTLLNLQLKRTELLSKFEPGYRTVREVETQIAQTSEALSKAEATTVRDQTTDLNRTHSWLEEELARAVAERATLKARSQSILASIGLYRQGAQRMNRTEMRYRDLEREAKTTEDKYLLYQKKEEEARISEALDRKRIVNAVVAEAPTVPPFPSGPRRSLLLAIGLLVASAASVGLAFVIDYLSSSFRTPFEVESILGVPVLASIPIDQWAMDRPLAKIPERLDTPQFLTP